MQLGYIGLGKMGSNMVTRLLEREHDIIAYDSSAVAARDAAKTAGATIVDNLADLAQTLATPRTVWLMVPHQVVGSVIEELLTVLEAGDTIIDGGNSLYKESVKRAKLVTEAGLRWLDVGVSGGPGGARDGACLMIGGEREVYREYVDLFADLAVPNGYAYVGKYGAGHFTKMVHNGIEYGMMQAIAEGFDIMRQSDFSLDLEAIAGVYNNGSVIESKLVSWLLSGFEQYGVQLDTVTGKAGALGEGEWTVNTADEKGIRVENIRSALEARNYSREQPNYQGKIISVLRNQFGGHSIEK